VNSELRIDLKNLPWGNFLFLTVIFWFASRANVFYSVEEMPVVGTLVQDARPDDWTKALALAAFTVWSGYTLLRCRRFSLRIDWTHGGFLLGYIGWCVASALWSDDAGLTMRKLAPFLITCCGAIAISYRFAMEEVMALSFFSSSAMMAAGLAAEILLGSFQPWNADYRFKGAWHPNMQAINLSVVILSGLMLAPRARRLPSVVLGTVFGACGLL